ncbi:hypothetical protein ACIQ7Q_34500 [Streptomyces sp. NPDC096176]|uniref:hypothetical protein n=1 Tax=Streptomyces sp. NPDC096176 TaxID=3366079 RepID=UPI003807FFA4
MHHLKVDQGRARADAYDAHHHRLEEALDATVCRYAAATVDAVTALLQGTDPVTAISARLDGPVPALPPYTPRGSPQ